MTIIGMHIRHNWPEWVTWTEQKTVKSACGVRTTPRMSGIPAVTEQPAFFLEKGRPKLGWCLRCVKHTWPYLCPDGLTIAGAPMAILDLHHHAKQILAPIMLLDLHVRLERLRTEPGGLQARSTVFMDTELRAIAEEFPEALSTLGAVGFDIRI